MHATGNSSADVAMEWLFAHMEDADIDSPLVLSSDAAPAVDPEKMSLVEMMGFAPAQARQALKETGGDVERAVDWLFNHPDAQGEEESAAGVDSASPKELPGKSELPANFQLQSIICHKGASVHTGYVFQNKPLHCFKFVIYSNTMTNSCIDTTLLSYASRSMTRHQRQNGCYTMTKRLLRLWT